MVGGGGARQKKKEDPTKKVRARGEMKEDGKKECDIISRDRLLENIL